MDKIWDELHKSREWGAYPSEHVIRFFARNYYSKNRRDIKVLDFGCGGGAHTWYLAREGFDTYAFDGSQYAVDNAKKRLAKDNLQAHFSIFDGIDTKYEDNYFDAILDNVCIYSNTIEDIRIMYHHIYRYLKRGGKLLTVCFSKDTYGFGMGTQIENNTFVDIKDGPLRDRGIVHFFDESEIRDILESTGFINVRIDKILYTDNGETIEHLVVQAEK